MGETDIPYCDRTWDLTIGCRKRSPGCEHCWATRTVHRLAARGVQGYCGDDCDRLRQTTLDGRNWEPTDRVNLLPWNLDKPLHWRKPQFVFVNSKSDLFDERVPFEFIGDIFDVMNLARKHRFMMLTKEPGRMAEFLESYTGMWPLPHVILMVSVEGPDQMDRIDTLRQIPAAMRGVSFEPLIDSVSEKLWEHLWVAPALDWVVIGCEKRLGGRAGRWAGDDPLGWWKAAAEMGTHCRHAGVEVWMKQGPIVGHGHEYAKRVSHELWDFPSDCRVQEKPKGLLL